MIESLQGKGNFSVEYIEVIFSDATAAAAVIAALISFVCSFITSRLTVKHEMKKLEFAAKREDQAAEMQAFQGVAAAVTKYIYEPVFDLSEDALSAIAVARTIKSGYLGDLLDELSVAVGNGDKTESERLLRLIYANWIDPEKI